MITDDTSWIQVRRYASFRIRLVYSRLLTIKTSVLYVMQLRLGQMHYETHNEKERYVQVQSRMSSTEFIELKIANNMYRFRVWNVTIQVWELKFVSKISEAMNGKDKYNHAHSDKRGGHKTRWTKRWWKILRLSQVRTYFFYLSYLLHVWKGKQSRIGDTKVRKDQNQYRCLTEKVGYRLDLISACWLLTQKQFLYVWVILPHTFLKEFFL